MRCQKSSIYFGPWPAHSRSWLQERNPHSIQDAVGALSAHVNPFGMPNSSRHVSIFPVRKVLMACGFLVNVMLAWVREAPTLPAAVAKRKPAPWGSKKLNCFSPNAFGQKKGMNAPLGARFARPFCVCVSENPVQCLRANGDNRANRVIQVEKLRSEAARKEAEELTAKQRNDTGSRIHSLRLTKEAPRRPVEMELSLAKGSWELPF